MLAIAVNLHGYVITVPASILKAGLHRSADAQVDRQIKHYHLGCRRLVCCRIIGSIVNHYNIGGWTMAANLLDNTAYRLFLVISWDNNTNFGVPQHKLTNQHTQSRAGYQADLRLLVVCPLYPPHTGGLENHAKQFNLALTKAGCKILTWTPLITKDTLTYEESGGITIIRFPAWEIIPNYPIPKFWHPLFWKQWRLVSKFLQPYDELRASPITLPDRQAGYNLQPIVISRTRFFITSPMAGILARFKHCRWVHIEHGSDYVQTSNILVSAVARLYDLTFGRAIFLVADVLVANSKASAAFIRKLAPHRQVRVIYRGVEADRIAAIPPANLSTAYNLQPPTSIIYVGRLIAGKGVSDLIRAFARLTDKRVRLSIVGSGPKKKQLERLAQSLRVYERITWHGDTDWPSVISLLKSSDIAVNPSYTEGLPTAVIEAALCRRAIIATDVGGTAEVIKHNTSGLLIAPHDINALVKSLKELINDRVQRQQLGAAAYQQVQHRFSWVNAAAEYQQLFGTLLQNSERK